jgi:glutamate/tyrosine decarboxylase-like PLP-dependent enzyme
MNESNLTAASVVQTKTKCQPTDVALKSFFLGPQAENAKWIESQVGKILERWFSWRRAAFPQDGKAISEKDQSLTEFINKQKRCENLLMDLSQRFEGELTKFSPRYIGHMFSEISMPALLGHFTALVYNPNNLCGESSRVGVVIEKEALSSLIEMVGFPKSSTGHFTSGGTLANFEVLSRAIERTNRWALAGWIQSRLGQTTRSHLQWSHVGWSEFDRALNSPEARHLFQESLDRWANPILRMKLLKEVYGIEDLGPVILVPRHRHYSWDKGAALFGSGLESIRWIELDSMGRLDVNDLKLKIEECLREGRAISLCVSVAGTTELGAVDPVDQVQDVIDDYRGRGIHIWHHVDGAYGGFFTPLRQSGSLDPRTQKALNGISRVDSITIDPHKMGYVPYSSGTILFASEKDYSFRSFIGPYLQVSNGADHGSHTIEGSRSAAGAVATWLTSRSIGLDEAGYGRIIERTVKAKENLESLLKAIPGIQVCPSTDLNVLGFFVSESEPSKKSLFEKISDASHKTQLLLSTIGQEEDQPFYVSSTQLTWASYQNYLRGLFPQSDSKDEGLPQDLTIIRVCIMNPFFDSKEFPIDFAQEFTQLVGRSVG